MFRILRPRPRRLDIFPRHRARHLAHHRHQLPLRLDAQDDEAVLRIVNRDTFTDAGQGFAHRGALYAAASGAGRPFTVWTLLVTSRASASSRHEGHPIPSALVPEKASSARVPR